MEEAKKQKPTIDPNSAKARLGKIAAKAYSDCVEAKKRGELVGWCASNFPVEIPETLGLYVCYPENQVVENECVVRVKETDILMIFVHMPEYLLHI